MNLSIYDCRGQSYDDASNMRGAKNGVSIQILAAEPRATFVHCYGHALNLATADVVSVSRIHLILLWKCQSF